MLFVVMLKLVLPWHFLSKTIRKNNSTDRYKLYQKCAVSINTDYTYFYMTDMSLTTLYAQL